MSNPASNVANISDYSRADHLRSEVYFALHDEVCKRGLGYLDLDNEKALECFLDAKQRRPRNSIVFNFIGHALYRLGRYTEAEESFLKSAKLTPQSPISNLGLSDVHMALSTFSETPENSYAWIHACLAREKALQLGDEDLAKALQERIDRLNPEFAPERTRRNNCRELNNAGVNYEREGQTGDAERAFLAAIEQNPEDANPDYNLSVLYRRTAQFAETPDDFYKAQHHAYQAKIKSEKAGYKFVSEGMRIVFEEAGNTDVVTERGDTFKADGIPYDAMIYSL